MRILIIIPAYNEAENISAVIGEVRSLYPSTDLLVVDDGSADTTAVLAERAGAKVLRLPYNLGYGAAVQTGIIYAVASAYEVCVLIDGDGQMDPHAIPALINQVENHGVDLALGSRFLGAANYTIPFGRRLGIALFSKLVSFFTRQQITDPTSGFQAIGRRLMQFFARDNYPADYPDADMLIMLSYAGFTIREVPVTIRPRLRGKSMHGPVSSLYYIYKMFFAMFIALTQRRMCANGGEHATCDQAADHHSQPAGAADDCGPCASQATR
jgi:glycosyltransferase involved in cell wall biosynthesis